MKRYVFAIIAVLMLASSAFAADLIWTPAINMHSPSQQPIQFFGPDGSKTGSLTVNSTTVDLRSYALYSVWSASGTCFERAMPLSTSTKANYIATPVPNTSWHTRAVNPATPFVNFSGCVSGFVKKQ